MVRPVEAAQLSASDFEFAREFKMEFELLVIDPERLVCCTELLRICEAVVLAERTESVALCVARPKVLAPENVVSAIPDALAPVFGE